MYYLGPPIQYLFNIVIFYKNIIFFVILSGSYIVLNDFSNFF